MATSLIVVWVYAVLILAGGVMGYVKAGSKPSLISGTVFGILLIASGVWAQVNPRAGLAAAIALAVALVVVFVLRFVKTKQFMPAGLLALISMLAAILMLTGLKQ